MALALMPASGRLVQAVLRQQCSSSRDILPLSAVSYKHVCVRTYTVCVEILFIMHALPLKSIMCNFCTFLHTSQKINPTIEVNYAQTFF